MDYKNILKLISENLYCGIFIVDNEGKVSLNMPFNPNGAVVGIEGITSPNGRILGKMAHSERIGENLYKNVVGNFDQKIFEGGVNYFK